MLNKHLLHIAVALLSAPMGALAQSGNNPTTADTGGLEEVVVTAERREASLQSVPIAVTALTTEALENRQVTQAADLQRLVPSLRMSSNVTSPTNLSPSLRGSLQQDASLVVAESPFGIYVDEVYVGRLNGNNVTLADIERVEVLRGPQGTLYGRNTLSGAIKFVSRTPGKDPWLNATVGSGNHDQYLGSVSLGGPIGESFAGSIAAQINNKDGQYKNRLTGEDRDLQRNWAVRGKLRFMGGENFNALLSFAHSDSENDAVQLLPGATPADPMGLRQYNSDEVVLTYGPRTVATPDRAYSPSLITNQPSGKTKQTIASANLSYDFGAFTLRSITAYVKTDDFFSTDFGAINAMGTQGNIVGASDPNAKQLTQELQIQGSAWDDRVNYVGGLFYLKEEGDQAFAWQFFLPTSTSLIDAETKSYSGFVQGDVKVNDALKLTAGIRYTNDDKDFAMSFVRLPTSLVPGPPTEFVSLSNKYKKTTWKLGADYSMQNENNDSLLLYASVATGFKSGGYNGIAIFGLSDARSPYAPENNRTYEIGAKSEFLDRKFRLNAAYFLADISELALNATVDLGNGLLTFPVQNAGEATIKGLELEMEARPTENLSLFMNAAFLNGKYDKLNPTSAPARAPTLYQVQPTPPQTPSYTYSIGFDHTIGIGDGNLKFRWGADMYATDDYVTAATNDFVIKAYKRYNAFVGLDMGDSWQARLTAKNVNDKETIYVGSRGLGGWLVLPPREVMLTVSYKGFQN